MLEYFKGFLRSERGAVTVDWVVITAAVVSHAVLIVSTIGGSSESVGDGIGTYLSNKSVGE